MRCGLPIKQVWLQSNRLWQIAFNSLLVRQAETKNPCPMHIGQIIYALRQERRLMQERLALEVDTATSNLSRIEQGKSSPSIALLERLAQALGTSVTAIYAQAEGTALAADSCGEAGDFSREAIQLREDFRNLSPGNKRLTLAFVRMLAHLQQERAP